jgi:hypothetical protein
LEKDSGVADERLRGREQYLDEVQPPPPRWRTVLAALVCLIPPMAVIVGARFLLFEDMSTGEFAIRTAVVLAVLLVLWLVFFRRRLARER